MPLGSDDLNDSAILGNTTLVADGKGNSKLKIVLPSGRELMSEYVPEDRLKGQVLIGWCETVRSEVTNDAARAKRGAITLEETQGANPQDKPAAKPEPPNALEYAEKMFYEAQSRVELADAEAERWQQEQRSARVERNNWNIILKAMKGESI